MTVNGSARERSIWGVRVIAQTSAGASRKRMSRYRPLGEVRNPRMEPRSGVVRTRKGLFNPERTQVTASLFRNPGVLPLTSLELNDTSRVLPSHRTPRTAPEWTEKEETTARAAVSTISMVPAEVARAASGTGAGAVRGGPSDGRV
jgi:hypothetical protein